MGSSRERGFSVTPERLAFIEQKMREMGIESREALAKAANLSSDVIHKKLFSGRKVDRSTVEAIAKTLKIQPTELVESDRWYRRSKRAKSQASTSIDWQYVCRTMLDRQKKLSTNEVIASEAMQFDLLDDEIFISLALVERKEPEQLSQNVHPARPIEQYEEKPPIEYEQFREQILRQGNSDRIAIIGEPGAGKTTLLQHIAFWILDKELGLPIWISLGDLIKNGDLQRLKDYLTQVWLDNAVRDVTQDVKSDFLKQLNEQRVWLLLDGADEIVASSGIALREINNQLRGWISQSCIILTCRINVWEVDSNALRDFQTYRTKEFHYPTQVEQFIESGFRKSNQQSGERLKTELANTERTRLQQLVRNPLQLMMLCTTWHEQESLPATKAELYKRFVSEFYKWNRSKWKKKDLNYAFFPNTVAKQEKLNKALGRLACRALDEESSPFRLPHNLVFDELGDPDEDGSYFWLALNLGWLQVARDSDKPSDKVYTFFHPTFQEYFAALSIDDWHDFLNHTSHNPEEGTYRIFEFNWKEVILLWAGREEISPHLKDMFIKQLIYFDSKESFYWYKAFCLAAECMSEFASLKYLDSIIDRIIEWSFGYFDSKEKEWKTFINPISSQAKESLVRISNEKITKKLSNLISTCNNEKILIEIAISLANFVGGRSIAIQVLEYIIDTSHFSSTSIEAAKVLYKIVPNNSMSIQKLLGLLKGNDYRMSALALKEILTDKREVIKILESKIEKFEQENLNTYLLASTLNKIDPGNIFAVNTLIRTIPKIENESFCRLLIDILGDILEQTANKEAVNTLRALIKTRVDEDDEFLRYEAIINLSKIEPNNPENISELMKIVFYGDELAYWERLNGAVVLMQLLPDKNIQTPIEELLRKMIIENSHTASFCMLASEELAKIKSGKSFALQTLLDLAQTSQGLSDGTDVIHKIKKIITKEDYSKIIRVFKKYLVDRTIEINPWFYVDCYQLIWHCTQNMSYLEFYRAWNNLT
ncbi:NACHT domain-containing protein [Trichocoleus sp. ST-U3]